jgi:hypothetical protein
VSVEVAADFRRGSFSYEAVAVLAMAGSVGFDINTVLAVIGINGGGLIGFLKWLRGRPVTSIQPIGGDEYSVTTNDGHSTIINGGTVNLYQNSSVRYALSQAVEPLKHEGITEFRAGRGRRAEIAVSSDEVSFFDVPVPGQELLQDKVSREFVEIVGLSFNPDNVWRFRTADGTTFTSLVSHDRDFWRQIEQREIVFADGDVLEVDLHLRVTRASGPGPLRGEREIVKVIRHIPPTSQTDLTEFME